MKHALPALVTLFLVVFVSGCTNFMTPASTGNGVTILAFEPELDAIYSGESVNFMLKIKNMGSFITNGYATIDLGEWGGDCTMGADKTFEDMLAPDQERGTEGEEKTFVWRCTAPEIKEGLHIPYNPRVIVTYGYSTITSKSVTLLPTQELLRLRDSGNALPSELVSSSDSPVDIDIQVNAPIRVREDTNSIEFPVTIKINNAGGGIVEGSVIKLVVEGVDGLNTIQSEECGNIVDLHLWRGQSQTITCKMSANNVPAITQARIVATSDYTYSVLDSTHIEVIGDSTLPY